MFLGLEVSIAVVFGDLTLKTGTRVVLEGYQGICLGKWPSFWGTIYTDAGTKSPQKKEIFSQYSVGR